MTTPPIEPARELSAQAIIKRIDIWSEHGLLDYGVDAYNLLSRRSSLQRLESIWKDMDALKRTSDLDLDVPQCPLGKDDAATASETDYLNALRVARRWCNKWIKYEPQSVDQPPNAEPLASGEGDGTATKDESEPQFIFRPDGNGYYVEGFGESGHYQQLKGLADLWRLVQSPGVGVSMLELDAGPGAIRAAGDGRSRQPIMESDELRQLNTDRKRYQTEVDEAENDIERDDSKKKLDECIEVIRRVTGLNGKSRDLNNPNDNLRAKIAGRIATACNTMQTNCPQLAQHFGDTCSANGALYVYSPGIAGVGWDTSKKQ